LLEFVYVLMSNHYHLPVETPDANIEQAATQPD